MIIPSRRRYTIITISYQYMALALALVIGVFLVPVYLHYIPVATYGLWLATGNVLLWISLVDPGLAYVFQQQAAKAYGEKDLVRVGTLCGTGVAMNLGLVALFLGATLALAWALPWIVTAPDAVVASELRRAFILSAVGGAFNLVSYMFRCGNQALHLAVPVGAIDLTVKIGGVAVVLLALRHGLGLVAFGLLALWTGLINAAGNGVCLWFVARRKEIRFTVSRSAARQLLGLVSFNFAGRLANVVQSFDLLVVNKVLGPEVTAVYGLTRRVPDFLRPLILIPVESAGPSLSHLLGEGDLPKLRGIILRFSSINLWLTGLATAGCLALNGDFVRLWVGGRLYAGPVINVLVCLQMTAILLLLGFSALCFYLGDIKWLNLVAFARSLLLFALIWVGASVDGLLGVAVGGLVAMVALVWYPIWSTVHLTRFDSTDIRRLFCEAMSVVVAVAASCLGGMAVECAGWMQFFLASSVILVLYLAVLTLLSPGFRGAAQGAWDSICRRFCVVRGAA